MKRNGWKKVIAIILCFSILPWSYYANALSVSAEGDKTLLTEPFHGSNDVAEENLLDINSISENGSIKEIENKLEENVTKSNEIEEKRITSEEMKGLVMSDYVLESDMVIDGDLVLTTGKLDINGHTLTVHGDVIQGDAVIVLNGGQMFVDKDYHMQTRDTVVGEGSELPNDNYISCKAVLNMTKESDYLLVKGSMYIQTETSHSGKLTAGVIEVKGDLKQINATTTRNFYASENHRVILSGEIQQRVEFESNKLSGSRIMNLEIANKSPDGVVFVNRPYIAGIVKDGAVKCEGEISIGSQTSFEDGYFGGSVYTVGSVAISKQLEIAGSMTANHTVTIYENMVVKGDFVCTDEYVEFEQATLTVEGKFEVCNNAENYGIRMTHDKDLLVVLGDFKYQGNQTFGMSAGTIQVKGNVNIESGFMASDDHRFVLNGNGAQNIAMNLHNCFATLEFQNDSEEGVSIYSALYYSELIENNTKITYADNMLIEDQVINEDFELTEELQINGKTLIINGDYVQKQGDLKVQGGNIIVTGDLCFSGGSIYLQDGTLSVSGNMIQSDDATLVMQEEHDHVTVYGDYELTAQVDSSELLTNGVLEIKGNFIQNNEGASLNYKPTGNHTLLLSGCGKQTISLDSMEEIEDIEDEIHTCINNLTIKNDSKEGVEFVDTPIVLGKIDAQKGIIEGCIKLVDDSKGTFVGDVYAGNIIWNKGTVEAEGDKLQILGDFTILDNWISLMNNLYVGGEIVIKNGNLRLGDYRLECVENLNIKTESGCGSAGLSLGGESSYVLVGGDFVCDVYWSNAWSYQKGIIEVKGDVNLVKNFYCNNKLKLILSGENKQVIKINNTSNISILEIKNTSEAGVFSSTYFEPSELILNNSKFIYGNGNENAIMGYTLTRDTVISGDCYLMLGTLDLNGYTLTVEGDFIQSFGDVNINGGKLYVYGDYFSEYRTGTSNSGYTGTGGKGKLIMQNPEDYVLIYGDLVWGTIQEHENLLTNGVLELKGDLKFFVNRYIKTSGKHTWKLSGKKTENGEFYKQYIAYNNGTYFNKLILTKLLEKGYTFAKKPEDICGELLYEYEDYTSPTSVTTLESIDVGMDYVTIRYDGATDESKIISYSIFRNGEKIAEVSEKEYTDRYLIPNTEYVYEVYAVDEFRNQAKESMVLEVKTLVDEEKPKKVSGVYVKSTAKTSVTIAWNKTTDNVAVAGYKVFRDGQFLCDNGNDTIYKDISVDEGKVYAYEIVAYDASANDADKSEPIEVTSEEIHIHKLLPEKQSEIGGEKIVLTGSVLDSVAVRSSKYTFEYREVGNEEWATIISDNKYSLSYDTNFWGEKKWFSNAICTWDSSCISGEDVEIRFSVIDEDGNIVSITNEYILDVTPPHKVKNVEGYSLNGVVNLQWDISKSEDCASYQVYRCEGNQFDEKSADIIQVGNVTSYYENGLAEGKLYSYAIKAVDVHGLLSEQSDYVTIQIDKDKENPIINHMNISSLKNNGNFQVKVSALDNHVVSSVIVYAREAGMTAWREIKTDKNVFLLEDYFSTSHRIDLYPTDFGEGTYEISVIAVDVNGNKSERSDIYQVEIDKTCPKRIENLHTSQIKSNYVQLQWDELQDTLDCYIVEQLEDGRVIDWWHTENCYIDLKGLNGDTSYVFSVVARDDADNIGLEPVKIEVHTTPDDVKPQINLIGPAVGAYGNQMEIMLRATDNQGLSKAVFSYSTDCQNYTKIAEVENYNDVYNEKNGSYENTFKYEWDVSEIPEGKVTIKYEVYDKEGNHNELIEDEEITMSYSIDHTVPRKVEDLKAVDNGGSILLTWSEVEEGCTYDIYRAEARDSHFYLIKNTDISTYADRTVVLDKAYMYKVIVKDAAGNIGEESNIIISSSAKDRTNPVIESSSLTEGIILNASPRLKFIITDNSILDKIKVEYLKVDGAVQCYTAIAEKKIQNNFYLFDEIWDTTGLESGEYRIKVTVTDGEGNENEPMIYACVLDTIFPQKPTLSMEHQDGSIQLKYSLNEEEGKRPIARTF